MCWGQEAHDHETTKANTPMADNRRADRHRRAGVDRTRNCYCELTHCRCAGLEGRGTLQAHDQMGGRRIIATQRVGAGRLRDGRFGS
jgi:hypothetical protein